MPAMVTTIKSNVIKSASAISLSYQITEQKSISSARLASSGISKAVEPDRCKRGRAAATWLSVLGGLTR
jgi:hypothetical protein